MWYDERNGEIKIKQIGTGFHGPTMDKNARPHVIDEVDGFWLRRTLSFTILPPQPVLVLESVSLQDSALMLLEGER